MSVSLPSSLTLTLSHPLTHTHTGLGKHVATIPTDAAPIAMSPLESGDKGKNMVVASFSDMTMATYNFESGPSTRYLPTSTWATPGVQMALAYLPANRLLYSGATNGDVYSWRVGDRKMVRVSAPLSAPLSASLSASLSFSN